MAGASSNQAAVPDPEASKWPSGPEALRILLVDDEPSIRQALQEYLQIINRHQVTVAQTGEEALAFMGPGEFDCAFLDLKMPGMNGVELLSRLKEVDQSLPVVIMTGFPSLDAAIDTMRQGASDFLIKPFSLNQVKTALERAVREQRLLRENLRLAERVEHQERVEVLNRELQLRIQQQNNLQAISETIDGLNTSEEIYQGMADVTQRFLATRWAAVLLLDRSTKQLLVIAERGPRPEGPGPGGRHLGPGHLRPGGGRGRTQAGPAGHG